MVRVKRKKSKSADELEVIVNDEAALFAIKRWPNKGWLFLGEQMDRKSPYREDLYMDWAETLPEAVILALSYMDSLDEITDKYLKELSKLISKRGKRENLSETPRIQAAIDYYKGKGVLDFGV